jgi:cell division protein FtsW
MHRKSVYFLSLIVAALMTLGVVMLFSTGAFARDSHGDQYYFVKHQLFWMGISLVVCLAAARLDYHLLQKWWWAIFALATVMLILCYVRPIGMKINGSWRWVNLHFMNFQPSELGKLAAVSFLAVWFSKYEAQSHTFVKGFVVPIACVGILILLIVREVDLGSTTLIGGTMFAMMFIAGSNLLYLGTVAILGVGGILFTAIHMPERLGRLLAFIYPDKYPTEAYQTVQGLIALGSGGVDGLGLGMSRQKFSFLPFAHTDFIFPVIGEELGLYATILVVLSYLLIAVCGMTIALRARDRFGLLLGFGLVVILVFQAAINIGVTTSLLPNKGLPLPFISYGGSNLLFCLLTVGILINIYLQGLSDRPAKTEVRLRARVTPRL